MREFSSIVLLCVSSIIISSNNNNNNNNNIINNNNNNNNNNNIGSQSVPIANADDKLQITGNFCINIPGEILPIKIICGSVTDRCPASVKSLESFHIAHSQSP